MDKQDRNQYMRRYLKDRYSARMKEAREILGGVCIKCGATENLDCHHVDKSKKEIGIDAACYGAREKFLNELKKCVLLCKSCHSKETNLEMGKSLAEGTHGTLSSYRYCKCALCRKAKSEYTSKYYKKNGRRRDR